MGKALVLCPATETTELVDFVETPLGVLIYACSRFRPPCAMSCARGCAREARHELRDVVTAPMEVDDEDTSIDIAACSEVATRPDQ